MSFLATACMTVHHGVVRFGTVRCFSINSKRVAELKLAQAVKSSWSNGNCNFPRISIPLNPAHQSNSCRKTQTSGHRIYVTIEYSWSHAAQVSVPISMLRGIIKTALSYPTLLRPIASIHSHASPLILSARLLLDSRSGMPTGTGSSTN
jgi:hypothetical protein